MRKLSFFSEEVEQTFLLLDSAIPPPVLGFEVDWRMRSTHLNRIMGDQRACPAIGWREAVGVTLSMPYTATFFRNGQIEVTNLLGDADRRTFRFTPWQGRTLIQGVRDTGEERTVDPRTFPQSAMTLPLGAGTTFSMNIFVLGDLRLNSWILDSGVVSIQPAPGYAAFLLPLPNHRYPPTYSVGQAITPLVQTRMHMKIAVDLDFSSLPADCDEITISRATPMMQWVLVRLPAVTVSHVKPAAASRPKEVAQQRVTLGDLWQRGSVHQQLQRILHAETEGGVVRLQQKACTLDVALSRDEVKVLSAVAGEATLAVPDAVAELSRQRVRELVEGLIAIEALEVVDDESAASAPKQLRLVAEGDSSRSYKTIVNEQGHQCIWPNDRPDPPGWQGSGGHGTKSECASYIVRVEPTPATAPATSDSRESTAPAGVQPTDVLVRSTESPFSHTHVREGDGSDVLFVNFGTIELCFDDPDLVPLGRGLVDNERFVAEHAQQWGQNEAYTWESVKELMDELITLGLLKVKVS